MNLIIIILLLVILNYILAFLSTDEKNTNRWWKKAIYAFPGVGLILGVLVLIAGIFILFGERYRKF
jgi:hypothetical protein